MKKVFLLFLLPSILLPPAALLFMYYSAPQSYSVSREIVIRRPAADVFAALSDLRRQSEYNYFNLTFPKLVFNTAQPVAGHKQQAEWRYEHVVVTAEIDPVVANREIRLNLHIQYGISFPLAVLCGIAEESRKASRLTCRLEGNLRYHERLLLPSFTANANQADPFADTLLNLKLLLEK